MMTSLTLSTGAVISHGVMVQKQRESAHRRTAIKTDS